jgi:hypothetical protein
MRKLSVLLEIVPAVLLVSCGGEQKTAAPVEQAAKKAPPPKPADETRHIPKTNLVDSKVIPAALMEKSFMPGGTLGHYKNGKTEYDIFVARMPSAVDAAVLLPDWRKTLTDSKLVPSFGGYFGADAGRPVFVFTRDFWIAGIVGLPEKQADLVARSLAPMLN